MADYAYAFKAHPTQNPYGYGQYRGARAEWDAGGGGGGGATMGLTQTNNATPSSSGTASRHQHQQQNFTSPPPPSTTATAPTQYRHSHTHTPSASSPPPVSNSGNATSPPPHTNPASTTSTNSGNTMTMATNGGTQPQQISPPTSLLWTDLEPWMDAEYARQVCALMRWDASVVVPSPPNPNVNGMGSNSFSSNAAGAGANNAGYAVLTFTSAERAAGALAKVNSSIGTHGQMMTMPNSARSFVLNWAPPGVGGAPPASAPTPAASTSTSNPANASSAPSTNANGQNGATANSSGAGYAPSAGSSSGSGSGGGVVSPTSPLSPVGVGMGMGGVPMGYPLNGVPFGVPGSGSSINGGMGGMNGMNGAGMQGQGVGAGAGGYPKEYSIFVGDLAPETSNSDLVAVFRNPVLGLRNDRAPKFIRPFASCKSAKIMLDPVTGVSRGYGFVRFTDEADQQRALIEMHGLYCLSRPMRISPATAKFKPPQPDLGPGALPASTSAPSYPSVATTAPLPTSVSAPSGEQQQQQQQQSQQPPSVSTPIAVPTATPYYPSADATAYTPGSGLSTSASGAGAEYFAQYAVQPQSVPGQPGVGVPVAGGQQQDEWRHTAQARAILGNLIGPNGEQLTSTDPYNTTVFVGGLSPLVGEETLRTFFVPFGEIHYVKVPVGKHCGFVQFVRKADAERAIEKMQGFPVGGSRIRLSWGRSQYKAAQAAAQAAQAAALAQAQAQTQVQVAPPPPQVAAGPQAPVVPQAQAGAPNASANANANGVGAITPAMLQGMTHEQAIMLLQKFQMQGYTAVPPSNAYAPPPNGYAAPVAPAVNANANVNGGYSVPVSNNGTSNGSSNNDAETYRNGFHSSSPSNSNVNEAYNSANAGSSVPHPQFTDEDLKVRRGDDGPFGYQQRGAYEVPPPAGSSTTTTSSFSPFSPDPNQHGQQQQQTQQQQGMGGLYAAAELLGKRRDSYAGHGAPYGAQGLPHPSKAANGGGKMSGSGSPTRGGYGGGGFAGSPPAFQINRYQSHAQTQPISRPNSGSAARGVVDDRERERSRGEEFDAMHDLNGTLASLDLDREREREFAFGGERERAWSLKSPTITESTSAESTSSGGSVQFRMTMGRTPSP
ncbi:hypothetical protein MVEN_01178300 [Mycena venus]|uniref:RRM domain-containing protein n=1 Tax=Mycena venus TaxID=2733690 RepID=A0A8H7CY17_9AGAR|nr:hypothetical protein MVEN_01178300 [Mycena venus]